MERSSSGTAASGARPWGRKQHNARVATTEHTVTKSRDKILYSVYVLAEDLPSALYATSGMKIVILCSVSGWL
jgi:hypothetical protein